MTDYLIGIPLCASMFIKNSKRRMIQRRAGNKKRLRKISKKNSDEARIEKRPEKDSLDQREIPPRKKRKWKITYPILPPKANSAYRNIPATRCSIRSRRERKLVAYVMSIAYSVNAPTMPDEIISKNAARGITVYSTRGKSTMSAQTTILTTRTIGTATRGNRTSKNENSKKTRRRIKKRRKKNIFIPLEF